MKLQMDRCSALSVTLVNLCWALFELIGLSVEQRECLGGCRAVTVVLMNCRGLIHPDSLCSTSRCAIMLNISNLKSKLKVTSYITLAPGVVSVLGNGTVLLVYSRKRKKLRPPELMTVNLAFCDFGFSLFGAPFSIISRYRRFCFQPISRQPWIQGDDTVNVTQTTSKPADTETEGDNPLSRETKARLCLFQPVPHLGVWGDRVPLVWRSGLCVWHRLSAHHLSHLSGPVPEDLLLKIRQVWDLSYNPLIYDCTLNPSDSSWINVSIFCHTGFYTNLTYTTYWFQPVQDPPLLV